MKRHKKSKNTVTVGPKHQVVIPKEVRRHYPALKAGARVSVLPLDDWTLAIRLEDKNWARTQRGGLKDLWEGIDVMAELKKMREEWDE